MSSSKRKLSPPKFPQPKKSKINPDYGDPKRAPLARAQTEKIPETPSSASLRSPSSVTNGGNTLRGNGTIDPRIEKQQQNAPKLSSSRRASVETAAQQAEVIRDEQLEKLLTSQSDLTIQIGQRLSHVLECGEIEKRIERYQRELLPDERFPVQPLIIRDGAQKAIREAKQELEKAQKQERNCAVTEASLRRAFCETIMQLVQREARSQYDKIDRWLKDQEDDIRSLGDSNERRKEDIDKLFNYRDRIYDEINELTKERDEQRKTQRRLNQQLDSALKEISELRETVKSLVRSNELDGIKATQSAMRAELDVLRADRLSLKEELQQEIHTTQSQLQESFVGSKIDQKKLQDMVRDAMAASQQVVKLSDLFVLLSRKGQRTSVQGIIDNVQEGEPSQQLSAGPTLQITLDEYRHRLDDLQEKYHSVVDFQNGINERLNGFEEGQSKVDDLVEEQAAAWANDLNILRTDTEVLVQTLEERLVRAIEPGRFVQPGNPEPQRASSETSKPTSEASLEGIQQELKDLDSRIAEVAAKQEQIDDVKSQVAKIAPAATQFVLDIEKVKEETKITHQLVGTALGTHGNRISQLENSFASLPTIEEFSKFREAGQYVGVHRDAISQLEQRINNVNTERLFRAIANNVKELLPGEPWLEKFTANFAAISKQMGILDGKAHTAAHSAILLDQRTKELERQVKVLNDEVVVARKVADVVKMRFDTAENLSTTPEAVQQESHGLNQLKSISDQVVQVKQQLHDTVTAQAELRIRVDNFDGFLQTKAASAQVEELRQLLEVAKSRESSTHVTEANDDSSSVRSKDLETVLKSCEMFKLQISRLETDLETLKSAEPVDSSRLSRIEATTNEIESRVNELDKHVSAVQAMMRSSESTEVPHGVSSFPLQLKPGATRRDDDEDRANSLASMIRHGQAAGPLRSTAAISTSSLASETLQTNPAQSSNPQTRGRGFSGNSSDLASSSDSPRGRVKNASGLETIKDRGKASATPQRETRSSQRERDKYKQGRLPTGSQRRESTVPDSGDDEVAELPISRPTSHAPDEHLRPARASTSSSRPTSRPPSRPTSSAGRRSAFKKGKRHDQPSDPTPTE